MASIRTSYIMKVRNLLAEKAFYRDILQLGRPVMDGSFWVEFRLSDEFSLCLEKIQEGEPSEPVFERSILTFQFADPEKICKKLDVLGMERIPCFRFGKKFYHYHDPEGNPFCIEIPEV